MKLLLVILLVPLVSLAKEKKRTPQQTVNMGTKGYVDGYIPGNMKDGCKIEIHPDSYPDDISIEFKKATSSAKYATPTVRVYSDKTDKWNDNGAVVHSTLKDTPSLSLRIGKAVDNAGFFIEGTAAVVASNNKKVVTAFVVTGFMPSMAEYIKIGKFTTGKSEFFDVGGSSMVLFKVNETESSLIPDSVFATNQRSAYVEMTPACFDSYYNYNTY